MRAWLTTLLLWLAGCVAVLCCVTAPPSPCPQYRKAYSELEEENRRLREKLGM